MNSRLPGAFALLIALAVLPAANAAPPPATHAEIAYLLRFVEQSGCDFHRNGSWYDSARAAAHLRDKYALLVARGKLCLGVS